MPFTAMFRIRKTALHAFAPRSCCCSHPIRYVLTMTHAKFIPELLAGPWPDPRLFVHRYITDLTPFSHALKRLNYRSNGDFKYSGQK